MTRHRNDFFFWTINSLYNFFSRSTQRWEEPKDAVPLILKAEAETRWSSRTEAVKPIKLYFEKIVLLLENMVEDDNQANRHSERWTTNLHQRQATSTWWWCSPFSCTGEGRNGLSIPRGSHPRAILPWTTLLLIFYSCCPMRCHIWTVFLNPIDRPPISSTFFRTTLPSPSFHPKPLHYSSHPPLILLFMLLLISGDIHPNPGPIDSCSVCSRRVTWGNRSVQCSNCSLWVHLSCFGLSPADFRKISPGHSWTCPKCPFFSQALTSLSHPNPVS